MNIQTLLRSTFLAACVCTTGAWAQTSAQPPAAPANPVTGEPSKQEAPKTDAKKDAPKTDAPAKAEPAKEPFVYIHMKTSMGDIYMELNGEKAPISTENFCRYVDKGFYEGTIFHRVINGFMIQGGGLTADLKQKPGDPPIANEWKNGLKNVRGSLAMARTNVADSATSQFFINVVDNGFLDQARDGAAYAVFGKVIAGMDVVDKIRAVRTGNGDVPVTPVVIEKVSRISKAEADKAAAPAAAPATPAPAAAPAPAPAK